MAKSFTDQEAKMAGPFNVQAHIFYLQKKQFDEQFKSAIDLFDKSTTSAEEEQQKNVVVLMQLLGYLHGNFDALWTTFSRLRMAYDTKIERLADGQKALAEEKQQLVDQQHAIREGTKYFFEEYGVLAKKKQQFAEQQHALSIQQLALAEEAQAHAKEKQQLAEQQQAFSIQQLALAKEKQQLAEVQKNSVEKQVSIIDTRNMIPKMCVECWRGSCNGKSEKPVLHGIIKSPGDPDKPPEVCHNHWSFCEKGDKCPDYHGNPPVQPICPHFDCSSVVCKWSHVHPREFKMCVNFTIYGDCKNYESCPLLHGLEDPRLFMCDDAILY